MVLYRILVGLQFNGRSILGRRTASLFGIFNDDTLTGAEMSASDGSSIELSQKRMESYPKLSLRGIKCTCHDF